MPLPTIDMQYTSVPKYTNHKEVVLNRKLNLTVVLPTKRKNKVRFPLKSYLSGTCAPNKHPILEQ